MTENLNEMSAGALKIIVQATEDLLLLYLKGVLGEEDGECSIQVVVFTVPA